MSSIMLKELLSGPFVMREVVKANKDVVAAVAKEFKKRNITNITTIARGTSDNAATYFKYLVEAIGGIMVSKFSPSIVTVYGSTINLSKNMVLAISQSGMSTDTLMSAGSAKDTGALVVAMTNNCESPLAKMADFHINLAAGEEISVPATKTFVAELTASYLLVNALAKSSAKQNIASFPPYLEEFIEENKNKIRNFAKKTNHINNFVILSRGLLQPVANEMSLKLMETTYRLNRPFSTTDFMHGPMSIIEEGFDVIMLAPSSEFSQEFIGMATRLSLLGANIVAFTDIKEVQDIAAHHFAMPTMRGMETPFVYTLAIELYAAYFAESLGFNPDAPRNLKKVTITK
jgi:glucosamine--fructose-6-phosphate aminotransferase (isomerizing)